jgi:hypothetical protein
VRGWSLAGSAKTSTATSGLLRPPGEEELSSKETTCEEDFSFFFFT